MVEEMTSLHQNQTQELMVLPKEKRANDSKWVYTKKKVSRSNNSSLDGKAHNKIFAQKECIDYNKVFSLVVKHISISILLALVAEYELDLA